MTASTEERSAQLRAQVTPGLHRRVRVQAAQKGVSITRYMIEALEQKVVKDQKKGSD